MKVKENNKKIEKPKDVEILISVHSQAEKVVKHDASGKKGMLSCCKCHFD